MGKVPIWLTGLAVLLIVGACSTRPAVYQRVYDPSPWWGYRDYDSSRISDSPEDKSSQNLEIPTEKSTIGRPAEAFTKKYDNHLGQN